MLIDYPQLFALFVAHHRERLIEAGTGVRRPARPTLRLRRRRRT
jgi:hypothetical protein